ncbi:hypothetical protein [Roseomonas xinghualingensis]|uniref:hypothetical protein n=1 Tax=Roseomonas xinghualingensis TaxID=2986475 RepID=UPI0021F21115|nr:hypothetical protein [Roseomonas sp. SXEYE001]MCV4208585.1 hypothetical protein [Roseomonas sp. SXEYE001]
MSYVRHTDDDLDQARDELRAELDRLAEDVMEQVPTCSGRGVSDYDLSVPQIAADIIAKHRIAVLAEINQRVRGMG